MSGSSRVHILDSYALLAYFAGEEGANQEREFLEATRGADARTIMSIFKLAKIDDITERTRGLARAQEILALADQLPVEIKAADRPAVLAAAHIKAVHPVAYADAFAIAVARSTDGVLPTGDPAYRAVGDLFRILRIGGQNIKDA